MKNMLRVKDGAHELYFTYIALVKPSAECSTKSYILYHINKNEYAYMANARGRSRGGTWHIIVYHICAFSPKCNYMHV